MKGTSTLSLTIRRVEQQAECEAANENIETARLRVCSVLRSMMEIENIGEIDFETLAQWTATLRKAAHYIELAMLPETESEPLYS
jgi:hypothetical protein